MPRFLVTYHGSGMPEAEEERQQAMAAFGAWVGATGKALVDPGAPLGPAKTVSAGSVTDGAAPFNGYSILDAADLDGAVMLAATRLRKFRTVAAATRCRRPGGGWPGRTRRVR